MLLTLVDAMAPEVGATWLLRRKGHDQPSFAVGAKLALTSESEPGEEALAELIVEGSLSRKRWFTLARFPIYEAGDLDLVLPLESALLFVRARLAIEQGSQISGGLELLSTATLATERVP
ncbi:MAG: hypothetical protein GY884_34850 [Proteobacteria bacterium]|nr:hypothetical protein [Pseudomonadota bacterium]